ncbi:MAG TPA: GNAT family N-acetyltransferase [Xanthobacteraceae bacterium]|nr:GNAT family N-acetyltransferase [Xanthobacteraceae bacterium]
MGAPAARWASAADMAARAPAWRDLADRAAEPNAFTDPDHMLAALRHLPSRGLRFLTLERDGRLDAVLPLRFSRTRWGVPLRVAVHHLAYAPHGTPLVANEGTDELCMALLHTLARQPGPPAALLLPFVSEAGAFAQGLAAALERSGLAFARFNSLARPALRPGADGAAALAAGVSRLAAKRRRLEREGGPLTVLSARDPVAAAVLLERFLALEAAGWKGRRGTAAGQQAGLAAMFRESVAAFAARDCARLIGLEQAGELIAGAVLVGAQDRIWFYKTAYDERRRRASPGVLLDLEVTRQLLDDPAIALADSLATSEEAAFGRLWPARLPTADWLVAVDPAATHRFALAAKLEALRRRARVTAKRLVQAARARRGLKG